MGSWRFSSSGPAARSCPGPTGCRDLGAAPRTGQGDGRWYGARRVAPAPGTTVFLSELDPDVLRILTQRKVVDTCGVAAVRRWHEGTTNRGRRGPLRGAGLPEEPEGVRLAIPARAHACGVASSSLSTWPPDGRRRRVAVVGRAGTTIMDDIAELEEFAGHLDRPGVGPGRVRGPRSRPQAAVRSSATATPFPLFVEAVKAVESPVARTVERIAQEVDEQTTDRLSDCAADLRAGAQRTRRPRQPDAVGERPGSGALPLGGGEGDDGPAVQSVVCGGW